MSASAEFVRYVRDQLASLGPLSDGMFFGGHAFKIRGVQFAMVMGNTLYLRVSAATRPEFERKGSTPFNACHARPMLGLQADTHPHALR